MTDLEPGVCPTQRWIWRAEPHKIVDGDTVDVVLDAGFKATRFERLRLLGLDTPELSGPDRYSGQRAKDFTEKWLFEACTGMNEAKLAAIFASESGLKPESGYLKVHEWPLIIETFKPDAFGRYLALVWRVEDGRCLNDDLLDAGWATYRPSGPSDFGVYPSQSSMGSPTTPSES